MLHMRAPFPKMDGTTLRDGTNFPVAPASPHFQPKRSSLAPSSSSAYPQMRARLGRSMSPAGKPETGSWQVRSNPSGAGLVIPRARVSHRSGSGAGGHQNYGYHSDDELMSPVEVSQSPVPAKIAGFNARRSPRTTLFPL